MHIQQLYLYPIKSTQAYQVSQAMVQLQGLNFDREFMLTEPNGTFITARKDPALFAFSTFPLSMGIAVHHQDGSTLHIYYPDFLQQHSCEVWGNHFPSWVAKPEINQWFSEKIGRPVQLRWLGQQSARHIKNHLNNPVSFADGYPILLTTHASLNALQQHCEQPINMRQFRPNIVLDGDVPFIEQQWQKIQIGEVVFVHSRPCERCVLTTRHPDNAQMDPKMEPFRTLKKINTNDQGKPLFGINLIPQNTGIIRVNDPVILC
ncbi:MOSC domain-containing protein [Pasteurella sp. PK-2025]|uniref:MOSC domain-containing protein n=1 Tax=Pasteurella sp. PK-2025 TaxID=3413133 RepID=UPI003C72EEE4